MKRLTALFLALLLLVLAGCHTDVPEGTTEPQTGRQTDPIVETTLMRPPEPVDDPYVVPPEYSEPPVITTQYLPENIRSTEDVPVLKWVCLVESWYGGRNRVWSEDAVWELNDMLDQMGAGFRIQFVMLSLDQSRQMYDWFSRTEVQEAIADADLIYGYMPGAEMQAYLAPITQYVKGADAVLEDAVPHSAYWHAGSVDGEVYGIPTNILQPNIAGWVVEESFLEELDLGLTAEDFNVNFWEADALLEKIAEYCDEPFFYADTDSMMMHMKDTLGRAYYPGGLYGYLTTTHTVGSCFAIDYSGDKPRVVNYFELEELRQYQQAVIRYKKAGYAVADNTASSTPLEYKFVYSNSTYSEDGNLYIPVSGPIFKRTVADEYVTGVAAVSAHKEEAVSLLAMIANDEEFRFRLFFGQEDRDYEIKNGYYSLITREDGSDYSMDFLSSLAYFCDLTQNPLKSTSRSPATDNTFLCGEDGQEKLQNLQQVLDASRICLPLAFDFTGCEEEIADLTWNFRRYFPYMTNEKTGKYTKTPEMTPALYDLMLMDLEDAGSVILQQELQAQLDDWLKENPDWE